MSDVPDFLIGGPPRAATGWMLSCLQEHPEAFVPGEEVNYFTYEYDHPASWYRKHFADGAPDQKTGEKSPSYLAHPEAPARIHDWNPEVNLVFSLRHPVNRAYAMYCLHLQNPHYDTGEDIETELTPDASIVQAGRYFAYLQRYREYFPDDQLHVLVFDDLKENPRQFARGLFAAVGVRPSFEPSLLDRKYGHRKKRGGAIWSVLQELSIRATRVSNVAQRVIRWARRNGYTEWIHRLRPGNEYPDLPERVRGRLNRYYADDVDRLRSYLGRDLPGWPGDDSR
jgi:hypothetical protein